MILNKSFAVMREMEVLRLILSSLEFDHFICFKQQEWYFTLHSQYDVTLCISSVTGIYSCILRYQVVDTKLMECSILL